jgi:hypothetical protein
MEPKKRRTDAGGKHPRTDGKIMFHPTGAPKGDPGLEFIKKSWPSLPEKQRNPASSEAGFFHTSLVLDYGKSLELILDTCLNAMGMTALTIFVRATSVEVFNPHTHALDR